MNLFLAIFAVSTAQLIVAKDFPVDLKKCAFGDDQCIKDAISFAVKPEFVGRNGIDLQTLTPLFIPFMRIKQGAESPVNIDLKFFNNTMIGIENGKAFKVKGFTKDLKGPHEIIIKGEKLTQTGPYSINGKVLILPIQGEGESNITIINPSLRISFTGKPLVKDGKTYLDVENFKFELRVKGMLTNLSNLFNGDKALGDNMNKFLNDNWKDIFGELKSSIEEAYTDIFKDIFAKVFKSHPYDELFLQ